MNVKEHKLATLAGALLETEVRRVVVSPPGAYGGVDILARKGPLVFDQPRLLMQVKSQESSVDVGGPRKLRGVMQKYNADQELLDAWGGVTKTLAREAQRLFFENRIWRAGDIVRGQQQRYKRISEKMRSDLLPLRRCGYSPATFHQHGAG